MQLTKALSIVIAAMCVTTLLICYLFQHWPDDNIHLIFCDIGQGDSILLSYRSTQVLIDSGPNQSITDCLNRHLLPWDRTLEGVIATHPDKDHIGGFPAVFSQYRVEHLFVIGKGKSTRDFLEFRSGVLKLLSRGTHLQSAHQGQRIILPGKYELKVISPQEEMGTLDIFSSQYSDQQLSTVLQEQEKSTKSINDESIATFLTIGSFKALLMADLEELGEQALLEKGLLTQVDVLKAGHHGSRTSTSQDFLAKTKPKFVVISAGKKNKYGHPHKEVLERVAAYHSQIFRTDQQGDVEWIVHGNHFMWRTQHNE